MACLKTLVGSKASLLHDFRWSKDLIPWHDILILLEDETVKLPALENIYSEDIVISTDVTIFATSKNSVKHGGFSLLPDGKTMSLAFSFPHTSKKICLPAQDVLQN